MPNLLIVSDNELFKQDLIVQIGLYAPQFNINLDNEIADIVIIDEKQEHLDKVMESESLDLNVIPTEYNKEGIKIDSKHNRLIEQKQEGLYTVYFHPIGGILKLDTLNNILECIQNVKNVEKNSEEEINYQPDNHFLGSVED